LVEEGKKRTRGLGKLRRLSVHEGGNDDVRLPQREIDRCGLLSSSRVRDTHSWKLRVVRSSPESFVGKATEEQRKTGQATTKGVWSKMLQKKHSSKKKRKGQGQQEGRERDSTTGSGKNCSQSGLGKKKSGGRPLVLTQMGGSSDNLLPRDVTH